MIGRHARLLALRLAMLRTEQHAGRVVGHRSNLCDATWTGSLILRNAHRVALPAVTSLTLGFSERVTLTSPKNRKVLQCDTHSAMNTLEGKETTSPPASSQWQELAKRLTLLAAFVSDFSPRRRTCRKRSCWEGRRKCLGDAATSIVVAAAAHG